MSKETDKHIDLLGYHAEDPVTGFKGIIDSISFDLYGCVQASLKPKMNEEGKIPDGYWFDVKRLKVSNKRVNLPVPNFEAGYIAEGNKGAADKPQRREL